jgi:hypothetical protein
MQGINHPKTILTLLIVITVCIGARAQATLGAADKTYGLDPLLHNGSFYNYHIPSDTKGNPFFNGPDFVEGTVKLRGITYGHVSLEYDVVNQLVLYQYVLPAGGVQHIVLSDAWMESFTLGDRYFELYPAADSLKQIFQVIGTGKDRILYAWSKVRTLNNQVGASHFVFSPLRKKMYGFRDGDMVEFKNNKQWLGLFPQGEQIALKKYLAQHHINLKKADDQMIKALIIYAQTLK